MASKVYICQSSDCSGKGSAHVLRDIEDMCAGSGVEVVAGSCLNHCGKGPNCEIQFSGKKAGKPKVVEGLRTFKAEEQLVKKELGVEINKLHRHVAELKFEARREAKPEARLHKLANAFKALGGEDKATHREPRLATDLLVMRAREVVGSDVAAAQRDAELAVATLPSFAGGHLALSLVQEAQKQWEAALESAKKSIDLAHGSDVKQSFQLQRRLEQKIKEVKEQERKAEEQRASEQKAKEEKLQAEAASQAAAAAAAKPAAARSPGAKAKAKARRKKAEAAKAQAAQEAAAEEAPPAAKARPEEERDEKAKQDEESRRKGRRSSMHEESLLEAPKQEAARRGASGSKPPPEEARAARKEPQEPRKEAEQAQAKARKQEEEERAKKAEQEASERAREEAEARSREQAERAEAAAKEQKEAEDKRRRDREARDKSKNAFLARARAEQERRRGQFWLVCCAPEQDDKMVVTCPEGHPLRPRISTAPIHSCRVCFHQMEINGMLYSCVPCQYNECSACYFHKLQDDEGADAVHLVTADFVD